MKTSLKGTLLGSAITFLLAFSCCWLPLLIVGIGGSIGLTSFSTQLESYSGLLLTASIAMMGYGGYLYYKKRNMKASCSEEGEKCCN